MKVITETIEKYQCENCNYIDNWEDDTRIHEFSCVGKGKDYILTILKDRTWYRIPDLETYELFEKTIEFWNSNIPKHFPVICNFYNKTFTTLEEEIKSIKNIKELEELNQNLEQKVKEQTKQLKELNKTLKQRVLEEIKKNEEQQLILIEQNKKAELGNLIGNISHQWKKIVGHVFVG
jgi:predicted transcriptional regulator